MEGLSLVAAKKDKKLIKILKSQGRALGVECPVATKVSKNKDKKHKSNMQKIHIAN